LLGVINVPARSTREADNFDFSDPALIRHDERRYFVQDFCNVLLQEGVIGPPESCQLEYAIGTSWDSQSRSRKRCRSYPPCFKSNMVFHDAV
jgi:hypothetical protein